MTHFAFVKLFVDLYFINNLVFDAFKPCNFTILLSTVNPMLSLEKYHIVGPSGLNHWAPSTTSYPYSGNVEINFDGNSLDNHTHSFAKSATT